ncbi:GTPase SAR1 family protein [Rubritalea squalenifaciens DSM 18772]|uniref:GTPase SAR1 family protein n=1 Tax=Rubritalea squalenifaciens DSM 18772 TaxID=1123071 RepID=A0A1M6R9W2_9BACT|nr:hypothetical protein [Rubritalea squalenifaciens]SHK29118.1 GTPase SAR1 family protein [Rubritalea squalenifaciens DSM 18772]
MLGEQYLETRESLAGVIAGIRALAKRSRASTEGIDEKKLSHALRRPFRIVVCGEHQAGKTSFLEVLVGKELVELEQASEAKVTIFRDAGYRVRDEREDGCELKYLDLLGDIELVDSSGLSKLGPEQLEALKYLIQGADYVYWVFPSENPWAATTWDFVTEMREVAGSKSAVVLQQIDRRHETDVPVLLGHLKDLCLQRVGHPLPIFPVSARDGYKAWSSGNHDKRVWVQSGFGECLSKLDFQLNSSQSRRRELRQAYEMASVLLSKTEEHVDNRSRTLASDQEYLQSIEAEIDRMREMELRSMLSQIGWLGDILESQINPVMRMAKWRLGLVMSVASLFGRGDGAFKVERFMLERVSKEAELKSREQARRMLGLCKAKWEKMRPAMEERLVADVGDFQDDAFQEQVDLFSEGLEKSVRHAMVLMKLRGLLDKMMMVRWRAMKKMLMVSLSSAALGGLVGLVGIDPHPYVALGLLGVSVAVFLWMLLYGAKTRRNILKSFAESLYDARPALIDAVQEDYIDIIRAFFNGYTPMFESIRRRIAHAKLDLQPQMKAAGELFISLKAVEQDI